MTGTSGIINSNITRPHQGIIQRFEALRTSTVSDAMNRMNAMRADIKPISAVGRTIAGSAVTVQCIVGDNLMIHKAIYITEPGDILVIDAKAHRDTSVWGGLMTKAAVLRGIKAVVIDGSIRDLNDSRRAHFPVFCIGAVPGGSQKSWGGNINVSIQCGGVSVSPGDIVMGDDDGIVVVPAAMAEKVLEAAERRAAMEDDWAAQIEKGRTTFEVIGLDKKALGPKP